MIEPGSRSSPCPVSVTTSALIDALPSFSPHAIEVCATALVAQSACAHAPPLPTKALTFLDVRFFTSYVTLACPL